MRREGRVHGAWAGWAKKNANASVPQIAYKKIHRKHALHARSAELAAFAVLIGPVAAGAAGPRTGCARSAWSDFSPATVFLCWQRTSCQFDTADYYCPRSADLCGQLYPCVPALADWACRRRLSKLNMGFFLVFMLFKTLQYKAQIF